MQAKNLKNLLKLFVLVAMARFPPDCHCTIPHGYYRALRELNEFLSAKEPGTAEGYFEEAKQELDRLNLAQFVFDLVVELGNLMGNIHCKLDEYQLIENMDIYGHKYIPESELGELSPIDLIAHQVGLERAEKCGDVWPIKYIEAHSNYEDQTTLKLAEYKAETFKEKRRQLENNDPEYIKYLMDYESFSDPKMTEDACKHLMRYSENDPNRCNFNLMYETYLKTPCDRFRQDFDWPYLHQAEYDSQMFSDPQGKLFDLNKSEYIPFYEGLAHNKACRGIRFHCNKQSVHEHWLEQLQLGNGYAECSEHVPHVAQPSQADNYLD